MDWWVETALITIGGIALALWLWPDAPRDMAEPPINSRASNTNSADTLADLLSRGCMTAEDLRALREGRPFQPTCPPEAVSPRAAPPEQRPFP